MSPALFLHSYLFLGFFYLLWGQFPINVFFQTLSNLLFLNFVFLELLQCLFRETIQMIFIDLCKIWHFYCPKFLNLSGQQVSLVDQYIVSSSPYFWSLLRLRRHQVVYLIASRIMQVFFLFNLAIHIFLPSILLLLRSNSMSQRFFHAQPISFIFFLSFLLVPLFLLNASYSLFIFDFKARFCCCVDHFEVAIDFTLILTPVSFSLY